MTCLLLVVEVWFTVVMDIYIIHELYIVKFIYVKNIPSHRALKLKGFALTVLGALLAVDGRPAYGATIASQWRELPSERVRGQLDGERLQA
jgi:hypothetical protein